VGLIPISLTAKKGVFFIFSFSMLATSTLFVTLKITSFKAYLGANYFVKKR